MSESLFKNKDFTFGFVSGVAVMAVVGLVVASILLVRGTTFGSDDSDKRAPLAPSAAELGNEAPQGPVEVTVAADDHIRGPQDAKITIVEFSDFQCPFCDRFHGTMQQVMRDYPDTVRWVYKHFPLDSIHPYARKAAEASECASDQGKFWEFADKIFENQSALGDDLYPKLAKELGLNVSKFNDCVAGGGKASVVNDDYQQGVSAGVNGTPGNFINGQSVPGAVPYAQIKTIIDGIK